MLMDLGLNDTKEAIHKIWLVYYLYSINITDVKSYFSVLNTCTFIYVDSFSTSAWIAILGKEFFVVAGAVRCLAT